MPDDLKTKSVVVHFMPHLNLPPEVIEGTGRIGQRVHASEQGIPLGYVVFKDSQTYLYPATNILKLVLNL